MAKNKEEVNKIVAEQEKLQEIYEKLQPLVTEFGLNYTGSSVHNHLEHALTAIRERNKDLTEKLED